MSIYKEVKERRFSACKEGEKSRPSQTKSKQTLGRMERRIVESIRVGRMSVSTGPVLH